MKPKLKFKFLDDKLGQVIYFMDRSRMEHICFKLQLQHNRVGSPGVAKKDNSVSSSVKKKIIVQVSKSKRPKKKCLIDLIRYQRIICQLVNYNFNLFQEILSKLLV